jgi:hypothetical protein
MKPKWRIVAERAYNSAFEPDEIITAMTPALAEDCHDEMTPRFIADLRGLCERQESLLFRDDIPSRLESLRQEAGTGMGGRILDHLVRLSKLGELTISTAVQATERAVVDRIARSNRQIEEHTLRNATASRANDVRMRLEQATAEVPVTDVARQAFGLDNDCPPRSALKRSGIDEGPRIK